MDSLLRKKDYFHASCVEAVRLVWDVQTAAVPHEEQGMFHAMGGIFGRYCDLFSLGFDVLCQTYCTFSILVGEGDRGFCVLCFEVWLVERFDLEEAESFLTNSYSE